jgi:hypothetical protein
MGTAVLEARFRGCSQALLYNQVRPHSSLDYLTPNEFVERLARSAHGSATDNAYIESFNGKFRTECLNAHWFMSLDDARRKCEAWRRDVETTTRSDHIAPSATKSRLSLSTDQRHSARPDRNALENAQQHPTIGGGSTGRPSQARRGPEKRGRSHAHFLWRPAVKAAQGGAGRLAAYSV